jgi:PhnB protein
MPLVNPYLSYDGNCREVMNFYNECLGGELTMQTVRESPIADKCPASMQDSVMHSSITKNATVLILGSDLHREKLVEGNTTTLCVACDSEDELNACFEKLSAGGKVIDPLQVAFWGDTFGVLHDKFGRQWMFVYHKK